MEDKLYIVTLHRHEDLEQFYNEMKLNDFHLVMKRPMSRNTHYMMTEEQAEKLRQDPRVRCVELTPEELGMTMSRDVINYDSYTVSGNFWKGDTQFPSTVSSNDQQWGLFHCTNTGTRGKGQFGLMSQGAIQEQLPATETVFSDGKHVDVVICDDPVSSDCSEWFSPTTGLSRFVEYDWYGQLNTLVGTIDDDSVTLPTGAYPNYINNASNSESHGTHVAGTVAGQFYGWARQANIYSMQVLSNASNQGTPVPALLIFDYLRAFHRNKPVNPDTGIQNPTITNHSWSYGYSLDDLLEKESLDLSDITQVIYRGTTYNSGNPNPSGWDWAGLELDFGFAPNKMRLNAHNGALAADVEDALNEGVVVIAAAGNNNFHCVTDGDPDWDNRVTISGVGTIFYNRGSAPGSADNAIAVGALSNRRDFRRSTYSNFGPAIEVFAPGNNIISAYNSAGLADSKYGGAPNYFYPIQGTSMASPQVAGVIACLATGKDRFSQKDAKAYLDNFSINSDMTFDAGTGSIVSPATFDITTTAPNSSVYTLNGTDRNGSVSGNEPLVFLYVGDTVNFNLSNVSSIHPFFIRDSAGGSNVSTPAATGQGSTGNATVSWTPNTAGTYYYQCGVHSGMIGTISVGSAPNNAGTFADKTCQKGSPNVYLFATNPRENATGMISKQINNRNNLDGGLTFPRSPMFHRPAPRALPKTLTLSVTNSSASSYVFNGSDRLFDYVDTANPDLLCYVGDTLVFQFSISGSHPFHVKTSQTTGTSDNVTTGAIVNNGQQSLDLTWNTTGVTPGTYYYICRFHSGMSGAITVTA